MLSNCTGLLSVSSPHGHISISDENKLLKSVSQTEATIALHRSHLNQDMTGSHSNGSSHRPTPRSGHGGTGQPSDEHTSLLAGDGSYATRHINSSNAITGEQSHPHHHHLDANASDLLLARTTSASGASALTPELLESTMLRGRQFSHSSAKRPLLSPAPEEGNADVVVDEESTSSTTTASLSSREFLIDTDPVLFRIIFGGVLLVYFIANFDGTIMASSHPVITSYFHSSNQASWLSTAFLLTSTAVQPVVGRLSDTIGRKPPYLFAMAVFTLATVWCALAGSMMSFIIARAVCGLGAGGMVSMGSILISDMVNIE